MAVSLVCMIETVLGSSLLERALTTVPDSGATESEIADAFSLDGPLASPLLPVLRRWNGLDLEVIRIHGVGPVPAGIQPVTRSSEGVIFASDPSGFAYAMRADGAVYSLDHDGGAIVRVADDAGDFLCNYVFGSRAEEFAGPDWAEEVARAFRD